MGAIVPKMGAEVKKALRAEGGPDAQDGVPDLCAYIVPIIQTA